MHKYSIILWINHKLKLLITKILAKLIRKGVIEVKKRYFGAVALCMAVLLTLGATAKSPEMHWYCTRNKTNSQALCAPELRVAEEFGGVYIDHVHNDQNAERVVYLTFDAGYENGNVAKILNTLKEKEVPAAFFVLSHFVEKNAELVLRMQEEGHLICNHTAHHRNMARASREEIEREIKGLEESCESVLGTRPAPFFRPPEGSFSVDMLKAVQSMGYKTVFWSLAYADWDNEKQPDPEKALALLLANMHNGAVVLLHPTSATNATILPRLIDALRTEGYRFGSLDELCG